MPTIIAPASVLCFDALSLERHLGELQTLSVKLSFFESLGARNWRLQDWPMSWASGCALGGPRKSSLPPKTNGRGHSCERPHARVQGRYL